MFTADAPCAAGTGLPHDASHITHRSDRILPRRFRGVSGGACLRQLQVPHPGSPYLGPGTQRHSSWCHVATGVGLLGGFGHRLAFPMGQPTVASSFASHKGQGDAETREGSNEDGVPRVPKETRATL